MFIFCSGRLHWTLVKIIAVQLIFQMCLHVHDQNGFDFLNCCHLRNKCAGFLAFLSKFSLMLYVFLFFLSFFLYVLRYASRAFLNTNVSQSFYQLSALKRGKSTEITAISSVSTKNRNNDVKYAIHLGALNATHWFGVLSIDIYMSALHIYECVSVSVRVEQHISDFGFLSKFDSKNGLFIDCFYSSICNLSLHIRIKIQLIFSVVYLFSLRWFIRLSFWRTVRSHLNAFRKSSWMISFLMSYNVLVKKKREKFRFVYLECSTFSINCEFVLSTSRCIQWSNRNMEHARWEYRAEYQELTVWNTPAFIFQCIILYLFLYMMNIVHNFF